MEEYIVEADKVPAKVKIKETKEDYVSHYEITRPEIREATEAVLSEIREEIVRKVKISAEEFVDAKELDEVKKKFRKKANELIKDSLPGIDEDQRQMMIGNLLHEMLGLGDIELLLEDPHLEEVVVNSSSEPIWVYHKKHGWLKTDIIPESEEQIYNYSSTIGRRIGKQISNLHPLLDAHLPSGDRTNATIFPISTNGNTLTVRKFARSPWTITDFIQNGTITREVAALLWLCIQYEMNIIVSGGTGSGKCLTGDSRVLLSNGTTKPIKEIVETELEENIKNQTEDGWFSASSEVDVFSFDEKNGIEKEQVSRVWKRKASDKLYKIVTASGREITSTPEHPFYVNEGGKLRKVKADQLDEDEYIPIPRKIDIDPGSKKLKIKSWIKEKGFLIEEEKEDVIKVRSSHGKPVKLPKETTPELAELTGLIIGDGHLDERAKEKCYSVEFHNSNPEIRKEFGLLCKDSIGAAAKEREPKNRVNKSQVCSRVFLEYLKDLYEIPSGAKADKVKVPQAIKKSNKKIVSHFLKGIFEAEGSVSNSKGIIEMSSASKELISDLSNLLLRFGIVTRRDEKDVDEKTYFRLKIGPESVAKFQNEIGFISSKKQNILEEIDKIGKNTNVDLIPSEDILRKLKQVGRLTDSEIAERARISRRSVGRYLDGSRVPSRQAAESLNSCFERRIEELKLIKKQTEEILEGLKNIPSRKNALEDCLNHIEEEGIEKKKMEEKAGMGRGLIWRWENETSPGPKKLENFADSVCEELGLQQTIYKAPNFSNLFENVKKLRKSLNISPAEIKQETGIDIGTYEANTNKTTTVSRLKAMFSYIYEICKESLQKTRSTLPQLKYLIKDSLFWDRIKSVEAIKSEEEWVYDLTVPENHTFISNEIVAHNTSMLNVLTPFIPPDQRIISIEDTREIRLPEYLHWVPLTTREENPEGKGGVSMLDLLVNSLRMRPDRIIVGEIRRKRQAEVLFEAMHTGHSVYSTLHADTAEQTVRRLSNPPINVPVTLLDAVDLNVVMFRDRRKNIRRVMEVGEVITEFRGGGADVSSNILYRWYSKSDKTKSEGRSRKLYNQL